MAKIRVIGKVATNPVSGVLNNSKFIKYLIEVSTGGQNSNPRLAQGNIKKSYFAVMAFGKQSELPIAKGVTVEVDGKMEISKFQLSNANPPKDAVLIHPQHTTILQGNIQNYAKAYNVLGNLVKDDADVYVPQNGGNAVYSQKIAVNRKVKNVEYTSFFGIKLFGDRGEILSNKHCLNKSVIKSVLVDGTISATYTTKETAEGQKEYFNVDINVNDFQIASRVSTNNESSSSNNDNMNNITQNAYDSLDGNIPNVDDIDEDEIPF